MALVTAIAVFAYEEENKKILLVTIVIVCACWITDTYFLRSEKRFRALYNTIRQITDDDSIDFNMDIPDVIKQQNVWLSAFVSNTFGAFYFSLFILHLIILDFF